MSDESGVSGLQPT